MLIFVGERDQLGEWFIRDTPPSAGPPSPGPGHDLHPSSGWKHGIHFLIDDNSPIKPTKSYHEQKNLGILAIEINRL